LATIADAGAGILLYQQQEGRGIGLMAKIRTSELQDRGLDTMEAEPELAHEADRRYCGLSAQILKQLGVESVRLITNNPRKIAALELAGIKVVEHIVAGVASEHCLGTMGEKDTPPPELVSCVRQVIDY
jgi:GTP cyclohydrolase II